MELPVGLQGVAFIHRIVPLKHAHRLVPCDFHDRAAVDASLAHVRVEGVTEIRMEMTWGALCSSLLIYSQNS